MESEEKKEDQEEPWGYIDFQIVKIIMQVYQSTTQLRQNANQSGAVANWQMPGSALEHSLLNFAVIFKSYILTDSRILALSSRLAEERGQQDQCKD